MNRYFYQKNPWWENKNFQLKTGVVRPKYLTQLQTDFSQELIQIVTGLRRVGKSTLILQLIEKLIKNQDLNPQRVLLFSIEEPSIAKTPIIKIINQFRALHKLKSETKIYVFIDEIQFRADWEREIKSLYDSENIKFVLTGSSAMLLSEKLSFLTGRYLKTQVFPLDFREYIKFKKINPQEIKKADDFLLNQEVISYLQNGGMPEFVLNQPDRYLQTTIESILFKDLVSKFKIRNPQILSDLLYLLADRVGTTSSSPRLSRILEINKDSVLTYLNYLEQTFITHHLNNYSTSRNKQIYNPPKIYFSDLGVARTYAAKTNFGALAENAVFGHLNQQIKTQPQKNFGYWHESKQEIDFVLKNKGQLILIESKWVDSLVQIDFKPLKRALLDLKLSPNKIIYVTKSLRAKIKVEDKAVELMPLTEFLLEF